MRGTFANIRIRNEMVSGIEGGMTKHLPDGEVMPIYDAAMEYQSRGRAAGHRRRQGIRHRLVARLGREGHVLLGVTAVIAESFERIHRSNLVGMGVLPLQFKDGATRQSLKLAGTETFDILGAEAASSRAWISPASSTATTARRKPSSCSAASTRSTRSNISATAGFCSTCCAT